METILQAIVFITISVLISLLIENAVKLDRTGVMTALVLLLGCFFIFFHFFFFFPDPNINVKWACIWGGLMLGFFAWGTHAKEYKEASNLFESLGTFFSIGLYVCLF